jgi:hypothetical protein
MPRQATQTLPNFMGDNLSVNMLRAIGNGVADDGPAFQAAIDYLHDNGGGELKVPAQKTYLIKTPITLKDNVYLVGQGENALLKRYAGADLPDETGLLNIRGKHCGVRRVRFDGAVTVPVGVRYGTFADPSEPILSRNSTIWVHGGCKDVSFENIGISHTGGYAIYLDARTENIEDVLISGSIFENNRPHLFGTDDADLNYGAWTSGIFWKGICVGTQQTVVHGLRVTDCDFRRNNGNQVWGHANGYDAFHRQIQVTNNRFLDIGLDCIEIAVASGGCVTGNSVRRVGYITLNDVDDSIPRRHPLKPATAFDSSGCKGFTYANNSGVSIHGGTVDLDGFCYGTVTGNVFRVPDASEPEYLQDRVNLWADNLCIGINTGNTFLESGGEQLLITNNILLRMKYGGIRLNNARGCRVSGNLITATDDHAVAPIMLYNTGADAKHRATGNDICENTLALTSGPGVEELFGGNGWDASDRNWVAGNKLPLGGLEFRKHPSSGSTTMTMLGSEASSLTTPDPFSIKRLQNADGFPFVSFDRADGNYMMRLLDDGTIQVAPGAGVIANIFNSAAVGAQVAVQQKDGYFTIRGDGSAAFQSVLAGVFNSVAVGADAAFQQKDGAFVIRGNGNGEFQALIATVFNSVATGAQAAFQQKDGWFTIRGNGAAEFQSVTAGVFNSAATGTDAAFQQKDGWFVIRGNGTGEFQSVLAGVFNSVAEGGAAAFQQKDGWFTIYGNGSAAFQSISLTNPLAVQYGGTGSNSLAGILPQPLATNSNVTFGSVVAPIFNSTASTNSSAFQHQSGSFVIYANGHATFGDVAAGVFNSVNVGAGQACFQQKDGAFVLYADGYGAFAIGVGGRVFESVAVGPGVPSFRQKDNTFVIYADGYATFNIGVGAGLFNSLNTGGAPCFQQKDGTFVIYANGHAAFGSVAAGIFNSVSEGANVAFQQKDGTFVIYGDGHGAFNWLDANAMYIGGNAVSTRLYAEQYSDSQNLLALNDHIAAYHGSNLH